MGQSRGAWICPTEPVLLGMQLKWFVAVHFSPCGAEGDPLHSGGQKKGLGGHHCQNCLLPGGDKGLGVTEEPPARCWA